MNLTAKLISATIFAFTVGLTAVSSAQEGRHHDWQHAGKHDEWGRHDNGRHLGWQKHWNGHDNGLHLGQTWRNRDRDRIAWQTRDYDRRRAEIFARQRRDRAQRDRVMNWRRSREALAERRAQAFARLHNRYRSRGIDNIRAQARVRAADEARARAALRYRKHGGG